MYTGWALLHFCILFRFHVKSHVFPMWCRILYSGDWYTRFCPRDRLCYIIPCPGNLWGKQAFPMWWSLLISFCIELNASIKLSNNVSFRNFTANDRDYSHLQSTPSHVQLSSQSFFSFIVIEKKHENDIEGKNVYKWKQQSKFDNWKIDDCFAFPRDIALGHLL